MTVMAAVGIAPWLLFPRCVRVATLMINLGKHNLGRKPAPDAGIAPKNLGETLVKKRKASPSAGPVREGGPFPPGAGGKIDPALCTPQGPEAGRPEY